MVNGYCIIVTKYRLHQGLALYHSLIYNSQNPEFFVLCMDDETYNTLRNLQLNNVTLIPVAQIEDAQLKLIKNNRELNEYCWTLKPVFLEYVLNRYFHIDRTIHLDADICFFNDPKLIFETDNDSPILLSGHNYSGNRQLLNDTCGKYNSGFIAFTREGIKGLQWWKNSCIECCSNRTEDGKFGDQKYLDNLPDIFNNVREISSPGANVAPWNDSRYKCTLRDGSVFVNNVPLIFYHFAGLRILNKDEFTSPFKFNKEMINFVYKPYFKLLQKQISEIERISPNFDGLYFEESIPSWQVFRGA